MAWKVRPVDDGFVYCCRHVLVIRLDICSHPLDILIEFKSVPADCRLSAQASRVRDLQLILHMASVAKHS